MSAYPAYNYDALAYDYDAGAARRREEPQKRGLGIEVLPGKANRGAKQATHGVIFFAKLVVAIVVAFALIGIVRITLSSATVAAALEAKELDAMITQARDEGSLLEVTQSSLANPSRIKQEATAIGMAIPSNQVFMDMSGDIVVLDEEGNLSLTGTVDAMKAI